MKINHRFEAYLELFKRYRDVFRYFWSERKNLGGGLFNEQEAEFLPAALAIQERPVSKTARITAAILIGMIATLFLWSVLGKMDIVVNATGKIIPADYTKTIASVEVASVTALHVQEGQFVKAGALLIELNSAATDAEYEKAFGSKIEARLQEERSRTLIEAIDHLSNSKASKKTVSLALPAVNGVTPELMDKAQIQFQAQYLDFKAKLAHLDTQIVRYAQALPLATQKAIDYRILAQEHDVSTHAYLEKEQARIDLAGQLADMKTQRSALIAQAKKEAWDAMTEGRKTAAINHQDAIRAGEHSKQLKLTAPVDGTVQQLTVHTVGGVVPAAQMLMMIVPKANQVEVEAFIENKDIGFVQEGQKAEVKIDAFEYSKYGTVPARVSHVSRDAIQDEKKGLIYSVKVVLERPTMNIDGKKVALSAGMSSNVEIKTGERRIIEYILSPLVQHQHESLNER